MKILVVDDEQLLVKGMKFNLENEGYTVETAYDGATAIDMAKTDEFASNIQFNAIPPSTWRKAAGLTSSSSI